MQLVFNEDLLFRNNSDSGVRKIRMSPEKKYIYTNNTGKINLSEIRRIIGFICSIRNKHRLSLIPIVLDLGRGTIIEDKLSYILLECICYHLIEKEKCNLTLSFLCPHTIYNEGIKTSYLKTIDGTKKGLDTFSKHFQFDIRGSHFRRVIQSENFNGEQTARLVQDIDNFLKFCLIQKDYRTDISEIVGELIDNSLEHSGSDCLVDIDVTTDYEKNSETPSSDLFCGVNIVVLNFSNVELGDGVAKKLQHAMNSNNEGKMVGQRYLDVLEARKVHSSYWNEQYSESDFNIIASFQHKISCRLNRISTGGTGLTHLIRGLEEKSDAYECYTISGSRRINFIKSMLTYDENNWVGFNEEGDFFKHIPSPLCIKDSGLNFPGTAYNLNFVMKREVN